MRSGRSVLETDAANDPGWKGWALAMCNLLDRIAAVSDDSEAVHKLCQGRFELAREHGVIVEFLGPTTGMDQ